MNVTKSKRRWLQTHAYRIVCPECEGKKKADIINGHTNRCVCVCPKCRKLWVYVLINMRDARNKWRTGWHYSKDQIEGVID